MHINAMELAQKFNTPPPAANSNVLCANQTGAPEMDIWFDPDFYDGPGG